MKASPGTLSALLVLFCLGLLLPLERVAAFTVPAIVTKSRVRNVCLVCRIEAVRNTDDGETYGHGVVDAGVPSDRRLALRKLGLAAITAVTAGPTVGAHAYEEEVLPSTPPPLLDLPEMKEFVDPVGLFSIRIPKTYYALRRSAKGDLPDAKTGQGRRGASIFTAGDLSKAEVVAVERFPTTVLMSEFGMGNLDDVRTFPKLGKPITIASMITTQRDQDKKGQSQSVLVPDSVSVSDDGKTLNFMLRTEIEVQKPELLFEQYGVWQLFRVTVAKASLGSNDGNMMAVFASALEQDFKGPDGAALRETVESFQVTDRSLAGEVEAAAAPGKGGRFSFI